MAVNEIDESGHAGSGGADFAPVNKRPKCERCRRPMAHCLCALIPTLDSRTRVLVLQHPDESRHALNTARLAVLGLRNAALHVGRQFDAALWSSGQYEPFLLFPGEGARVLVRGVAVRGGTARAAARGAAFDVERGGTHAAAAEPIGPGSRLGAEARPVLLVVPDGTWRHARHLLATHSDLAALPRVTLPDGMTTRYRVRHAGDATALSTIEAIAAALDVLEAPQSFAALLAPFEALVATQIAAMGAERYERHHVRREGSREERTKTNPREP
ncbi:tRNA-uridine aminocarboxypropyltransferase [Bordetella tumbae]|uniref:tRNA-uridine aminocarboxypropyltransferase n=1 Tax=Bordetella tumbae TaxID=1649139 RepID=UPI0039EF7318